MDNTSSIYVPHGSCYEDSSVFQYQKMNYESYQLNNWTSTRLIISEIPFSKNFMLLVTKNYMM